jgi:hypothetical protein
MKAQGHIRITQSLLFGLEIFVNTFNNPSLSILCMTLMNETHSPKILMSCTIRK